MPQQRRPFRNEMETRDAEQASDLPWVTEKPVPLPPTPPPLPWYRNILKTYPVAIWLALVFIGTMSFLAFWIFADRDHALQKEAYGWSQVYVRRHLLNPETAIFLPFPHDDVEISMDIKKERFIIRSTIEVESPTGIRIYHSYTTQLYRSSVSRDWVLEGIEIR
jgi:hypothetical protein